MRDPATTGQTNAEAYAELAYDGTSHHDSHPSVIWPVAALLGLDAPPPATARVLEIGCARGVNLVPMAASLPDARFVGVDLDPGHIAQAEALRAESAVTNLELRVGDIRSLEDLGAFDYIIAHGVYSWIPADARAALLAYCGAHLTPNGVAYISHNVYPGWHRREALRRMMLYHLRDIDGATQRVEAARALLGFMANASAPEDPSYKLWLHQEADSLAYSSDDYIFHEHIAVHNAPTYFYEFVATASDHGLQFVGDAAMACNFGRLLPNRLARDLTSLTHGERIAFEQYQDFVLNRTFRKTLLCHADRRLNQRLDPSRWRDAHVSAPWQRDAEAGPRSWRRGKRRLTEINPAADALLEQLAAAWPGSIPVPALFEAHRAAGLDASVTSATFEAFCDDLFLLAMNQIVELRGAPIIASTPSAAPRMLPSARAEIAAGLGRVTTARHRTTALPDALQVLGGLLDGREIPALLEGLVDAVQAGRLPLPDGVDDATPDELRQGLAQGLARGLDRFHRMGLLR